MVIVFAYRGCAPSEMVRQEAIDRYNRLVQSPIYVRLFYQDGAPYLTEDKDISITHTNTPEGERIEFIAVSDNAVGIDVESMNRQVNIALVKRYFTDAERAYIGEDKAKFLEIWSKREAYGKSTKVGLYKSSVLDLDNFYSYEVYKGYNTVIYSKDDKIVFIPI